MPDLFTRQHDPARLCPEREQLLAKMAKALSEHLAAAGRFSGASSQPEAVRTEARKAVDETLRRFQLSFEMYMIHLVEHDC